VNTMDVSKALWRLRKLRNIGPKLAADLLSVGVETPEQMRAVDPEVLYEDVHHRHGGRLDRCVVYAFRGAKYDIHWPRCKDPFSPPDNRS
jgi:hypothetical protein